MSFSSQFKFPKTQFFCAKFRAKFEVLLQNLFLSIFANHSKSDFSTGKLSGRLKLFLLKIVQRDTGLRAITATSYKGPREN